jgi:hypothetical protein
MFPVSKFERGLREPDIDIKYTIPYEWGTLRVSEAADEAYGFVPLTAQIVKGNSDEVLASDNKFNHRADIILMSPDEYREHEEWDFDQTDEPVGIGVSIRTKKQQTLIKLGLTQDRQGMLRRVLKGLSEETGVDEDEIDAAFTSADDDIPATEKIAHELPQDLIHAVCDSIGTAASTAAEQVLNQRQDRQALRRAAALGGTGLASAGVILGLGSYDQVVDVETVALAGTYVTGFFGVAYSSMRQYLSQRYMAGRYNERLSYTAGQTVAESIHKTFCARHFDRQIAGLFPEDEPDSDTK